MNYYDEASDGKKPNKIPYDDTPISRPTKSSSGSARRMGSSLKMSSKVVILFLAVSLIINVGLCISTIYYILHGVSKTVNVYYNDIVSTGQISSSAAMSARWSTVAISAGVNRDRAKPNLDGSFDINEDNFSSATYSHGAGIIYSIDRINESRKTGLAYFVTCYHVIEGYKNEVYIMLPSSTQPIHVNYVGGTSYYDVAVLSYTWGDDNDPVEDSTGIFDEGRTPQYANSYELSYEPVFAVGNPLSLGITVTDGLVSKINTFVKVDNNKYITREIQTSAEIISGNSGGGLFDAEGNFVGLVNSRLPTYKEDGKDVPASGMAYAIPGTFAISIARSIMQESDHMAKYPKIGATFGHAAQKGQVQVRNKLVEIFEVVVESASGAASGNLKVGDIVKSFSYTDRSGVLHEDVIMFNEYVFEDISFDIQSGSNIIFKITRPADRKDYTVTIKVPNNFQECA